MARDKSEVSLCIKYLIFGFNVLFWLLGALVFGVGVYAWVEKGTFGRISEISSSIIFDPALLFLIVGAVMFLIGFFGCIGALRENTTLLLIYIVSLAIILLAIVAAAAYAFIEQDKTKDIMSSTFKNMVINYRDDEDLKDIINWAQQDWLFCCGVDTWDDWDLNVYFNCSSPSVERCGVPSSCCKVVEGEELKNLQCGFGVRDSNITPDPSSKIYDAGCLQAFTDWINQNLIPIAGAAVGISMLLILGICFAQNLRTDIQAQKAKWQHNHRVASAQQQRQGQRS